MGRSNSLTDSAARRQEAWMAWVATLVLVLYSLWVGAVGYSKLPLLFQMQEGLGIKEGVSAFDTFLASHSWLLLVSSVGLSALLIAKEALMEDKRRSIVITCLVAVIGLVMVDATRLLLMRPFAVLIEKLS
jgi:hypothetical protein